MFSFPNFACLGDAAACPDRQQSRRVQRKREGREERSIHPSPMHPFEWEPQVDTERRLVFSCSPGVDRDTDAAQTFDLCVHVASLAISKNQNFLLSEPRSIPTVPHHPHLIISSLAHVQHFLKKKNPLITFPVIVSQTKPDKQQAVTSPWWRSRFKNKAVGEKLGRKLGKDADILQSWCVMEARIQLASFQLCRAKMGIFLCWLP